MQNSSLSGSDRTAAYRIRATTGERERAYNNVGNSHRAKKAISTIENDFCMDNE